KIKEVFNLQNIYVEKINEKLLNMFSIVDNTNNNYPKELLNTFLPNGFPPHKLILKVNYPIILLRNLDPSNSLCNGTRMVINNGIIRSYFSVKKILKTGINVEKTCIF
ncbi:hypothetical protein ES288_A08G237200v1, partial [Gossypium darwinii]